MANYGKLTCQVCGDTFATLTDKAVHASTAHDLGRGRGATERTRTFRACAGCTVGRVFIGDVCDACGTTAE